MPEVASSPPRRFGTSRRRGLKRTVLVRTTGTRRTVLKRRRRPARPRATWSGWRWEAVAVAAVLALVAVCFFSLRWYGFDVLEEGYFLTNARVVQHGGLPYRDFDTPYTPGVFYLYAWVMDRLGPDLLALRTLQIAGRVVCYLALYLCGRQLVVPFFAALAPAAVLVMDVAPELWGIHPGWYAAPAAVLAVLAVARYLRTGRARWLFWSGVASGISFAFKQNLAAYGLVAALWLTVVAADHLPPVRLPAWLARGVERPLSSLPRWFVRLTVRGQQVLALLLFPLVPAVLTRPYWSPLVLALFTIPLAALSAFAALWLTHSAERKTQNESGSPFCVSSVAFFVRPLLLLAGFSLVTLPWLVALLNTLHWQLVYLGPVVGKVDPTGYFYGMQPPTVAHVLAVAGALVVPVIVGALCVYRLWSRRGLALVAGVVTVAALARIARAQPGLDGGVIEPWNAVRGAHDILTWAGGLWSGYGVAQHRTTDLVLYLPAIAFWASFGYLSAKRKTQNAKLRVDRDTLLLVWLLASGAALFLNQYPRMDEIHWLWSSGVLLAAGAVTLQAWERHARRIAPELARSASARVLFRWSLALLPLVAVFPRIWWRVDTWMALVPAPPDLAHAATGGGRAGLVPLSWAPGVPPAWVPREQYLDVQEVVDLLEDKTAPGEPIFTYPAIPGFYFLADRPNPTRFNHLFNGMASPADQQEIVRELEQVRYVVWDDGGAHYWVQPGVNPAITEYVRIHFRVERYIGDYTVLARDARGPALAYTLPAPPPQAPNTATASASTNAAQS